MFTAWEPANEENSCMDSALGGAIDRSLCHRAVVAWARAYEAGGDLRALSLAQIEAFSAAAAAA
jgi:hypothetical protein